METLLDVRGLKTYFFGFQATVRAVDDISFSIRRGETVGLVGESGSGKSVTALSIMGLVRPPGKIIEGQIIFKGMDLLTLSNLQMQGVRGQQIGMIFQNPSSCLNPVLTIREQVTRVLMSHKRVSRREAIARAEEMLRRVAIADPSDILRRYPHELSGGMCQRVMIVMALICGPDLLIADEPTTGLDVTTQSQILTLMREIREATAAAQILITHDLAVVAQTCDRVLVLYAGHLMEAANVADLFSEPLHPYSRALVKSVPRLDLDEKAEVIRGYVPSLRNPPPGCRFHPRCRQRVPRCEVEVPTMVEVGEGRLVACHLYR